ncbi:MAG TPA: right-handed parallel beta-helix repeat-containing protein [Methylophilaceae bacterium]|nr:right-handed parallel beta-helix repeat-containing protein [Methylophilaceae bacterium]
MPVHERTSQTSRLSELQLLAPRLLAITAIFILLMLWLESAMAAERFVAPDEKGAVDAGPGSAEAPYKTIAHAMSQLQPGDKLTIAAGTYREPIIIQPRTWPSGDTGDVTVIEGKGKVVIKGSEVIKDWRELGNGLYFTTIGTEPQQVFVDGQQMIQIGGTIFGGFPEKKDHQLHALHKSQKGIWPGRREGNQDNMPVDSFYYDKAAQTLYLKLKGNGIKEKTVEVSTRPQLLVGNDLRHVTIKNINFEHSNTSTKTRAAAVTITGQHITLENINVSRADSTGIDLWGDDITLKNSSANDCGQIGLKARGKRIQLIDNETSRNNTRGFNKWWEAGGAKFVGLGGLQDSVVSGHRAYSNHGDGIWFDWKNRNNTLKNGNFSYNQGFGIQYEASDRGTIVNNIVIGNEQRGIYLPHTSHTVVAFNLIAGNHMQGIAIVDENRRDKDKEFDFSARGNKVFGNVLAWNGSSLVLPTEIADNQSDGNIYIGNPTQTNPGLGWVRMFSEPLDRWSGRTQQDKNSLRWEGEMDEGLKKSIADRNYNPDLNWYQSIRNKLKPVQINPEWLKLVPGITDTRPGPNL